MKNRIFNKRVLSFLLTLLMIVGVFPAGAFAVSATEETQPVATEVKVANLTDLQAALAADNDLHIVVTAEIQILTGETVELDLNGKTVTSGYQTESTTKHIYPLNVYGNLTIKDSKGNGSITGRGILVQVGSKLTIDGGSIYAIDSNGGSALFMHGGDVVINGGHVEQKASGTYNFAINANAGTVTVNDGWVGGNHGAIAAGGAAVVINGGELVCTGTAGMTDNVLYTYGTGSITINGGTFTADKDIPSGGACVYDANGKVTINGGTFGNSSGGDVWGTTGTTIKGGTFENLTETQHIADGYELKNGSVVEAAPTVVEVDTLDELLEALAADNNLPIVITASIEIGAGEDVVLNLNGKSISATGMNVLRNNNGGKLTIQNGTVERTGDTAGYAVSSDNAASILIIENATIKGGVYTSGALIATNANISQHFSGRHSIYASGCKVTLNSGTYHNYNAGNATIFVAYGAEVIIEGGSFSIDNGKQTHGWTSNMIDVSNGSCVMNGGEFKGHFRVQANGSMTINGGTFENTHGEAHQLYSGATISVTGGIFTDDSFKSFAKENLADGYELGEDGEVVKAALKISYAKFNELVRNDTDGVYDGNGITVVLKDSERSYQNNKTAQFFVGGTNVNITDPVETVKVSNVTFVFEDDDTTNNYTSGELQVFAKYIEFTGCIFNGVAVSPWGMSNAENAETAVFTSCTWNNLSGRYGVHQNRAAELTVTGCTFNNCERGIHTNSSTPKSITITNNTFTGIGADFGVLCLAENGDLTKAMLNISDNTAEGQTMLRQLNQTTTYEQVTAILDTTKNTYGTAYTGTSVVPAGPVAEVAGVKYMTLAAAFAAVTSDNDTVTILSDVTENLTGAYLRGNIVGDNVTITLTNSDWVYCPYTFVIDEGVTLKTPALFYYAGGSVIKGTLITDAYYQRYAGTKLYIEGAMTVTSETFILRYTDNDANAGIYVNGGTLNASVIYFYQGMISATNGTINVGTYWQTNETDGQGSANLVLDNSTLNVTVSDHPAKATGKSTVTLTNGSEMNCQNGGFTYGENAWISVDSTSSIVGKGGEPAKLPVAKIGDKQYTSLEDAFAAAAEGDTITLLADVTPALTSQRAITKAAEIDLGGKTLTLKEDDLYFGTTTFKNGTIVVDPSVKPSTAVFWMFANQTLTFNNVKIVATGVTGTYLIGLDGNNSDLNLLNGSEILVENTTALDLDIICVNASTGNDILVENSKVNVTNLDGRVFFRGNYTISGNSDIDLSGITKAGFRIEAGQTLTITDTATVDIVGEPRDGGIHLTDVTATYTKADTATVTATINAPKVAQIGDTKYTSLTEAVAAAKAGDEIVLLADVTLNEVLTLPASVIFNGNGKTVNGTIKAGGDLTFKGATTVSTFNPGWYNNTITIGEDASLKVTSGRMTVSYGNTFNITGSISDAKAADKSAITPSLELVGGISFTGNGSGVTFNVTNAYVKLGDSTTKNSAATGEFNMNFKNSIVDFTKTLKTYMPTASGLAPEFNFTAKDSVVNFASHLELWLNNTTMTLDNTGLIVGGSFANAGTVNVTNGSNFVVKAPIMSSHGGNTGTIVVNSATFELVDSNQDWENAGTMTVDGSGKLITNDFKNVEDGEVVLKSFEAVFAGKADLAVKTDMADSKIVYEDGNYKLVAIVYVAKIGEQKFESLQAAIEAVQEGETIVLLSDVTITTPAYGQNALNHARAVSFTLDLNGKTLSANTGNSVFRFNINQTGATSDVTVTIKNGKVVAGANTWCALMASGFSADAKAVMNLEKLVVECSKAGDLGIKAWDNGLINAKNVTVNATNGAGGFYAVGGEIVLDNCTVNQKGLHTAPYLSMAIAVSSGGKATVNSGTYSAEPTAAAEGYNQGTSHGSWVAGVMNSGGTLIINGGTFSNDNFDENSLATNARGAILADTNGIVEVNGGTFNALKSVFDFQNNLGATSPVITVKGGTYSADPSKVTSYGSVKIADGYCVTEANGVYTVEKAVAMIGTTGYATLEAAIKAAQADETVYVFAGTYAVPSMKAGITIEGIGDVLFEGTLSGTLENLTLKNIHIKGGNAQRWAYAKGNLVFEKVTFEATSVYALHFDGIAAGTNLTYNNCTIIGWAAMGGTPESCVFDGCTIKGNGTYGVIRTYFDATIKDCTFDVANTNTNDAYEDGIHAVDGAEVTVTDCTNVNGDMKDIVNVSGSSVVVLDDVQIKNVAKIGGTYYTSLAEAFASVQDGDTVELLADTTVNELIKIEKDITLDLNGKTVTAANDTINLEIYNELTIKDTVGGGVSTFRNHWVKAGKLTLESGTLQNIATASGGFGVSVEAGSTFVMNGGAVKAVNQGNYAISVKAGATAEINGGVISGNFGGINNSGTLVIDDAEINVTAGIGGHCVYVAANAVTTINGGDFNPFNKNTSASSYSAYVAANGKLIVTGGSFEATVYGQFACSGVNDADIAISGGKFDTAVPEKYCAERYIPTENTDGTFGVRLQPVAKVGNTEYTSIDEAIAAWTNGTTLTLLADVTLSDVIKLKSTEHHTLDLGTYTMTAASGKNAIEITCEGRSSASYAITINADATNPGGITATGKACIYYSKSGSTKDRPIIRIYNGVFNGSYSINSKSNGNTNCPQIWIYGGTFNGNVNLTKNMLRVFGGTFNGWINCTGDSSAYREISGGRFKSWQFMTADADNKFWVGTSKANYNVGVYVDDEGYLVVGGDVVTEAGDSFEASSANYGGWSSYLKYSSAKDNSLYYTSVEEALADNNKTSGSVTVYVDKLDMRGINYKGTIVAANADMIIKNAPDGLKVVDTNGNKLEIAEDGTLYIAVAKIGETYYATLADALAAAQDGDTITLISGDTVISMAGSVVGGKTVTITGSAIVDWTKGNLYIGRGGEGDGKVIFDGANITSSVKKNPASTGIHVSGSTTSDTVNNGVLVIKNSTIEVDYLINRNEVLVDGDSTLTVYGGCYTHGRDASESSDGTDKTATLTIESDSTVIVVNENGMGVGGESNGIMTVKGTYKANNLTISSIGRVTVDGGTLEVTGTIKNAGADTTFKNATVKAAKLLNSAALFIEGENTIQIEDVSGSTYAVRVRDGAIFNNSYMPGGANETVRLLGSATFNGGFKCAYLQGAGTSQGGAGGTVTIKDGTTVEVSYGVEFSNNYVLNGGEIKLTGGNASGKFWGCVFQNATFEINTDIVVESNGATAPIHFTKANVTINSDFSQSNPGGEVVYMTGSSVTVTKDASITSSTGVHVNNGATLKSEGDIKASLKNNDGTIEISGGTYTQDVSEWCADGYTCEAQADGTYGVRQLKHLIINVGSAVATRALAEDIKNAATMDEAVALAKAAGADYVTYKISGAVKLTTGGSHGILDLGKNVIIEGVTSDAKLTIVGGGVPDIKGVTFKNITLADEGTYLPTANEFMYQNYIDCTFENVKFEEGIRVSGNTTITNCTITSSKNNQYALWSDGGTVTMTGTIVNVDGEGYGMVKSDKATEYVLKNNTFEYLNAANKEALNTNGATINASKNTFIGCDKGIIPADKTNYAADGTTPLTNEAISNGNIVAVAKIGETYYATLEAAIAAANAGETITLLADIEATAVILIDKSITINGNGHKVTSSATRVFRVTTANVEVTLNEVNMVSTAVRVGTNDVRGISIDSVESVELTLNNCSVDFTDASANDWAYAVNVTGGSNHTLTVNGGTYEGANVINVRGTNNTIVVKNATLTSTYPNNDQYYGACIYVVQDNGSSVSATGNTFKGTNAVAFNVGYTPVTESNNNDNTTKIVAKIGDTYYTSLAEAFATAQDGDTVKLLQNAEVSATIKNTKQVTLDLNGKTITGTDNNTSGNFYLIDNRSELTITGNGTITLVAKNDRDWNASSVVVANNPGGKLVVEGGTIEHLGGTDMAYAIDNLTNGKGTYAETVINGGTIKSTYRAVRQFLNGVEAQNILTINGGTIEGANKSVWMQDPSKNANTGKLTVGENAKIEGDIYLFVTAGSTEWPVEVSIATSAVNGEIVTGNVPAGYITGETNGIYGVSKDPTKLYIYTLADFIAFRDAVNSGTNYYEGVTVYLMADIDLAGENWIGIGSAYKDHGFMGNFDGNGFKIKNLTITNPALDSDRYAYAGLFAVTEGIDKDHQNIIKNLTIENVTISTTGHIVAAAIAYPYYTIVDNVTVCGDIAIEGGNYTAGVLAYTRRCVNASNLTISGNEDSYIKGAQTVGGVISDIQMNGGLTAVYSNFKAEGLTITGTKMVGGISGIIAAQTLNGATVKNVILDSGDSRVGIVAGSFGGTSTITNVVYENVNGATAIVGSTYDNGAAVQAKIGDTYYATFDVAYEAAKAGDTITLLAPIVVAKDETLTLDKAVTITYTSNVAGEDMITVRGTLNVAEGKITYVNNSNGSNVTVSTISAEAGSVVNVTGGIIENKSVAPSGSSSYAYAIDMLTNGNLGDVTVNISGGTVYSYYVTIRQFNNGDACKNTLNVTGGNIYGAKRAIQIHFKNNAAYLAISDGVIKADGDYALCLLTTSENITVSGGTFNGNVWYSGTKGFISGGTFADEFANKYCAPGFIAKMIDGKWIVDDGIMGDVNGDGKLTSKDVVLLRQYVAGLTTSMPINVSLAYVSNDNDITSKDVVALRQLVVKVNSNINS